MSTCISQHGEFSNHELGSVYICRLCSALDEDALIDELERLRDVVARVEAVAQDHAGTIAGEDLRDAIAGDDDE